MGCPMAGAGSPLVLCCPDLLPGGSTLSPALSGSNSCSSNPRFAAALLQARLDILKIHSRKMNLTRGINLRKIAELMPGASGAEVKVSWEHCHGSRAGRAGSGG